MTAGEGCLPNRGASCRGGGCPPSLPVGRGRRAFQGDSQHRAGGAGGSTACLGAGLARRLGRSPGSRLWCCHLRTSLLLAQLPLGLGRLRLRHLLACLAAAAAAAGTAAARCRLLPPLLSLQLHRRQQLGGCLHCGRIQPLRPGLCCLLLGLLCLLRSLLLLLPALRFCLLLPLPLRLLLLLRPLGGPLLLLGRLLRLGALGPLLWGREQAHRARIASRGQQSRAA